MLRAIAKVIAITALTGGTLLAGASGASAAHCVAPTKDSPGFSYFGNDHVQEADHAEGGNPGPHAGTSGASSCLDATGNPSSRAPGRN